jgi:hypothetical protein
MRKAFDALPKGGALAPFGMAMDADKKGPISIARGDLFMITGLYWSSNVRLY